MPTIVDYQTVSQTLTESGLVCNYHRSGSFGLKDPATIIGWTTEVDATIRPEMIPHTQIVPLAIMLTRMASVWSDRLPGELWIMPASHWAYELTYGNAEWLPGRLSSVGVDPMTLRDRNDGSAIAFLPAQAELARLLVGDLITRSLASDFTVAWPGHATVAMLHHHGQIWWQTADRSTALLLNGNGK